MIKVLPVSTEVPVMFPRRPKLQKHKVRLQQLRGKEKRLLLSKLLKQKSSKRQRRVRRLHRMQQQGRLQRSRQRRQLLPRSMQRGRCCVYFLFCDAVLPQTLVILHVVLGKGSCCCQGEA